MNFYASPATKDRPLRLMWKHRDASVRKIGQGNVYIKNLDKSINNKELYDTFSAFGNIMSCKVATDPSGNSKGYGFVHFEAPESAETAMKRVNGMLLAGRKVYVGPFLSKREREERGQISRAFTNVYVKNIDDSICTEEKLLELFEPYGEVTSIHVPATPAPSGSDAAPTPKGFAFINFAKPDEAAAATEALDGKEFATKALYVGRAQKSRSVKLSCDRSTSPSARSGSRSTRASTCTSRTCRTRLMTTGCARSLRPTARLRRAS
eukprot:TRINITY_DN48_c0_g1_i9.p2 TRINITY_DN48_c0_g1~~TRINITY_DN48_c0_g1_i9.p2  ORF type:complete len:265 (-),score=97.85 TRINITY_DN48_c0_g1_i9:1112-1906(-)